MFLRRMVCDLSMLSKKEIIWLSALLLIFMSLRLFLLFDVLTDHDEFYTIDVISRGWVDMHIFMSDDVHLPLFFYILKLVSIFVGVDHNILRFVSIVFGAAGLFVFYLLLRKFFPVGTSLIGLALLGVSVFHVSYSQILRMYSLLFFATCLALYFFILLLKKGLVPNYIIGFILSCISLMYTHFYGSLVVFFLTFLICYEFVLRKKSSKVTKKRLLGMIFGLVLSSIPFILFMLYQVYRKVIGSSYGNWMEPTHYSAFFAIFSSLSGSYILMPLLLLLYVYGLYVAIKKKHRLMIYVGALGLFLIFFPMLISIHITPIFAIRYFIVALPSAIILSVYGFLAFKEKYSVLALVLIASSVYNKSIYAAAFETRLTFILVSSMLIVLCWLFIPRLNFPQVRNIIIVLILFFLCLSTYVYFGERMRLHHDADSCLVNAQSYLASVEEGLFFTPRWLNFWAENHRPTPHGHEYYLSRFGITGELVNTRTLMNLSDNFYIISPPTFEETYDLYFTIPNHVENKILQCAGVDLRYYEYVGRAE